MLYIMYYGNYKLLMSLPFLDEEEPFGCDESGGLTLSWPLLTVLLLLLVSCPLEGKVLALVTVLVAIGGRPLPIKDWLSSTGDNWPLAYQYMNTYHMNILWVHFTKY